MKIIIEGDAKEIAALAVAMQERHEKGRELTPDFLASAIQRALEGSSLR